MDDEIYLVFTNFNGIPLVYSVHKTLDGAEKDVELLRKMHGPLRPYLDMNESVYWEKYKLLD